MSEKISVIIPAYNIEGYLGTTLESVLAQTYENLEIIVVNDGSEDGTAAVMESYATKDSRIKTIHKTNGGVTSARLRGVAESTGEYIGFVDGDDYIAPGMYEQLMKNMQQYHADISHCGYQMVFPSRVDYYHNTGTLLVRENGEGCTDLLRGRMVEPGLCNKLYHRKLFLNLDEQMDRTIRINEDLLMNFYLFRQADITVFHDVCLYHYVLRKNSAATSKLNEHKLKDPVRVLHRLLSETAEVSEWNEILQRRLIYKLVNIASIPVGDQRELVVPIRREVRKELRRRMKAVLTGKIYGTKLKIMAIWAAIWPASYGWTHNLYAKITGRDKKYVVK